MAKNFLNLDQIKKELVFGDANFNINFFQQFMNMKKEEEEKEYDDCDSIAYSLEEQHAVAGCSSEQRNGFASNIKKKKAPTFNFNGVDSIIKRRNNEVKQLKKNLKMLKRQSLDDIKQCKASKEENLALAKQALSDAVQKLRQEKELELQAVKERYAVLNQMMKHDYEQLVTIIKNFHDKQIDDITDNLQIQAMEMNYIN